jgi:hypothetical protein
MSKVVGIIAEDNSDINSLKILINRISKKNIGTKHFAGEGCSSIVRKCNIWAKQLLARGCSALLVVHDSDTNRPQDIFNKIANGLNPNPFKKSLICIPVQELEAWLLSDAIAIRKGMNLRRDPKTRGLPEEIDSPKEYLERIISTCSGGTRTYLNTIHNEKIISYVNLAGLKKKCPSFVPLCNFIQANF